MYVQVCGVSCTSNTCQNGGHCSVVDISVSTDGIRCLCVPGFTGSRCEVDVNECLIQPCQNNGTCFDQVTMQCFILVSISEQK